MATPGDLRERRRAQTALEITDAALTLFERDGVDATRVEDIAREAGISPRTFFRYFPSKERAVFCADPEIEARVEELTAALRADEPLLPQIEAIYVAAMELYANGVSESGRRVLRMWRLVVNEPVLRAVGVGYEEDRSAEFAAQLRAVLDVGEDDLRPEMIVELVGANARVAFRRWASARERGEDVDLLETYATARGLLRTLPGPG